MPNWPCISPVFISIDSPDGNAPLWIEYCKSPCRGSKSTTSIFITTLLSCLNDPNAEGVSKTGLLFGANENNNGTPSNSVASIVILVLSTDQKFAL